MGYFDSPKNKALWERELESLDAERQRRKEQGYKPHQQKAASDSQNPQKTAANPKVRKITLQMLEEIEKKAREDSRSMGAQTKQKQKAEEMHRRDRAIEKEEMREVKKQVVSI